MVWFKVDDKLHANTKIRKLLADEPAALALWTVAGSWVADELNDGFVPDEQLTWLMPARAEELAQKLVSKRLWRRVRGGYLFHEWHADGDGTKRNPSRAEVLAERAKKAEAGRKGGLTSAQNKRKVHGNKEKDSGNEEASSTRRDQRDEDHQKTSKTSLGSPGLHEPGSRRQAGASARAVPAAGEVLQPPTRPDPPPSKEGGEGAAAPREAPGAARAPLQTPPPPTAAAATPPVDLAEVRQRLKAASRKFHTTPSPPQGGALEALSQAHAEVFTPQEGQQ